MSRTPKIWFRQGVQLKRFWTVWFQVFFIKNNINNIAQDKKAGPNLKPLEHEPTLERDRKILKYCVQLNLITTKLIIIPTCNQREV